MTYRIAASSLVSVLVLTGCLGGESNAPAPTTPDAISPDGQVRTPTNPLARPATLRTLITAPRTLVVDPESSAGTISVRYRGDTATRTVALGVREGHLTVESSADGTVEVRGLSFALDDIEGAPIFEGGAPLPLTDVHASVDSPVRCRPFFTDDDVEATCEVNADIALRWSLALADGTSWPLDPQTLGNARIALHLFVRPDGRVGLDVDSATPAGGVWNIADVAELSGFALVAAAIELPPVL